MIPYEPLATDGERAVKGLCRHNKKEEFCAICELAKREAELQKQGKLKIIKVDMSKE